MLLESKQLLGAQIISLHTARSLGTLTNIIIDPDKLAVAGFYCSHAKAAREPIVLLSQDIRQAAPGRVFINSVDELTPASDLIRLKPTMELSFALVSKPVRTEGKRKLGKVDDYVVDTTTWAIQKIQVKQPLLKSFSASNLIIDRSQVIEVSEAQVTVSDTSITSPALAPQRVA